MDVGIGNKLLEEFSRLVNESSLVSPEEKAFVRLDTTESLFQFTVSKDNDTVESSEKSTNKKESMSEDQFVNVPAMISDIRHAAKVIRDDARYADKEPMANELLYRLERTIEAYEFVEKRQAKRKKEAEAEEREAEAVELLSRGTAPCCSAEAVVVPGWFVDLINQDKGGDNGYCR